jgi:hypothetical protein
MYDIGVENPRISFISSFLPVGELIQKFKGGWGR